MLSQDYMQQPTLHKRSGGLISAGMGMACHLAHAMQPQLSGLGFMKCFLHTTTFSA